MPYWGYMVIGLALAGMAILAYRDVRQAFGAWYGEGQDYLVRIAAKTCGHAGRYQTYYLTVRVQGKDVPYETAERIWQRAQPQQFAVVTVGDNRFIRQLRIVAARLPEEKIRLEHQVNATE
jgi:hypothetical protein